MFTLDELHTILSALYREFGTGWFGLANDVQKLTRGTERPGLGLAILRQRPSDITHAQAASYLGPVLEDLGAVEWNRRSRGIAWRLLTEPLSRADLATLVGQVEVSG